VLLLTQEMGKAVDFEKIPRVLRGLKKKPPEGG